MEVLPYSVRTMTPQTVCQEINKPRCDYCIYEISRDIIFGNNILQTLYHKYMLPETADPVKPSG